MDASGRKHWQRNDENFGMTLTGNKDVGPLSIALKDFFGVRGTCQSPPMSGLAATAANTASKSTSPKDVLRELAGGSKPATRRQKFIVLGARSADRGSSSA
jgi:hypothetical protein